MSCPQERDEQELLAEREKLAGEIAELEDKLEVRRQQQELDRRPVVANGRTLVVAVYVDEYSMTEVTPDEEYSAIESGLRRAVKNDLDFRVRLDPYALSGLCPDIYVFDYGGASLFDADSAGWVMRELLRQIDDHPNTLFIIWSSYTWREYAGLLREELRTVPYNVICRTGYDMLSALTTGPAATLFSNV